jgi:hypothetical protein
LASFQKDKMMKTVTQNLNQLVKNKTIEVNVQGRNVQKAVTLLSESNEDGGLDDSISVRMFKYLQRGGKVRGSNGDDENRNEYDASDP